MAKTTVPGSTTRRSFLAAAGTIGALAATGAHASGTPQPARGSVLSGPPELLAAARAWFDATVNGIVRAWEPCFRFRQFRRWEDGDGEDREPPTQELEAALSDALPAMFASYGAIHLALAVCSSAEEEDGNGADSEGLLVCALREDVLGRAERLGYFKGDPGALRFPDLPVLDYRDRLGDEEQAEQDVRDAQARTRFLESGHTIEGYGTLAEERATLAAAEERLAGLRAGTLPCLTREAKRAWHHARCEAIVAAYGLKLEAHGIDASWVKLPGKEALS